MRFAAGIVSGSGPWSSEDHAGAAARVWRICARSNSVDSFAWGPAFHVMLSACRPWMAAHVELATTTTPPAVKTRYPRAGISNTWRTPGVARAFDALNLAGVPPNVGQRAMTA